MFQVGPALALLLAAGPKYAVMPVAANEIVSEKSASLLTETLAAELRHQSGAEVITPRDLGNALSLEKQKQVLGCQTDSCMAEIAGAAGADHLVVGEVAQLGESLLVQLRLLDARQGKVVAQARRRFRRGGLDDLLDALPAMIGELLSSAPTGAVKGARPMPAPSEQEVAAATPSGTRPLASTSRELADGSYELDLAVPLASGGVMPVSFEVGPFTITELRVRNMPSDEETHDLSRGKDKSHPKPTITARSRTTWDAQLKLKVTLEDDQGKALMACEARKGLAKGESEELSMCWIASVRTLDWPKVKVFHVTGRIKKD